MSLAYVVAAKIDWTNAIVGAGLSAVVGLLVVVVFQKPLENVVFSIRSKLRLGGSASLDGIWLSHYEYASEDVPDVSLVDEHFIVLRQDGERVKGSSWRLTRAERRTTRALKKQYSERDDIAWRSPLLETDDPNSSRYGNDIEPDTRATSSY